MSFLYSYKPVLYPVALSTLDLQSVDDSSDDTNNAVLSLVALSCQKIVQVCHWRNRLTMWHVVKMLVKEYILLEW